MVLSPIAVVGLGFGDEGKGMAVATLSEKRRNQGIPVLVIRHNGGPQAQHNVRISGIHHTFSQFGSGTLSGCSTLLDSDMLIEPLALMHEADDLSNCCGNILEKLAVACDAPLLTKLHAHAICEIEERRGNDRHGSTGQGIHIAREYERECPDQTPRMADIDAPFALYDKLSLVAKWINAKFGVDVTGVDLQQLCIDLHSAYCDMTACGVNFVHDTREFVARYIKCQPNAQLIFESAQGILLDERYGFYPHITDGDMTPQRAYELCRGIPADLRVLGISRTYHTRHGAGPFPTEGSFVPAYPDDNKPYKWAGAMRTGLLDADLFKKAINAVQPNCLAVSCIDQDPHAIMHDRQRMEVDDVASTLSKIANNAPVVMTGQGQSVEHWQTSL